MEIQTLDKTTKIIVEKIGLSAKDANWCKSISEKYAIWIANQIKAQPDLKRKKAAIEKIILWKKDNGSVNLNKFDFAGISKHIQDSTKNAFKNNDNSLKNTNIYLDLGEYKWVELKKAQDCIEEGEAMGHCVGNRSYYLVIKSNKDRIFSLRDIYNRPHVTICINIVERRIVQLKGKENKEPVGKYIDSVIDFLKHTNEKNLWREIQDDTWKDALKNNFEQAKKFAKLFPKFYSKVELIELGIFTGKSYTCTKRLDLSFSKIEFLPANMKVKGALRLYYCTNLNTLPENLTVEGYLDLRGTNVTKLPESLNVIGVIYYDGTKPKGGERFNMQKY
jgi:hypothetical protein